LAGVLSAFFRLMTGTGNVAQPQQDSVSLSDLDLTRLAVGV
jgi:hypothetical protein